jgi:hypothetical protein
MTFHPSPTLTDHHPDTLSANPSQREPRQLSKRGILAVWAAAAVPMATLMWVVGPLVAHFLHGPQALTRGLILAVTAGLVWQFVLVLASSPTSSAHCAGRSCGTCCGCARPGALAADASVAASGWS